MDSSHRHLTLLGSSRFSCACMMMLEWTRGKTRNMLLCHLKRYTSGEQHALFNLEASVESDITIDQKVVVASFYQEICSTASNLTLFFISTRQYVTNQKKRETNIFQFSHQTIQVTNSKDNKISTL